MQLIMKSRQTEASVDGETTISVNVSAEITILTIINY